MSALLCVGILPQQVVRFCRLSHTIENEADPCTDRFPITEACRDNADDVPSPMTIDKTLHCNISDVFEYAAAVKSESKIGPQLVQPPHIHLPNSGITLQTHPSTNA